MHLMDFPAFLDPAEYIVVPNVFVIDEFDMTDDSGEVVARIDAKWIEKCVKRMNERASNTGDLCPFVIGHTLDNPQGNAELVGPPIVGYFWNWKQIPFFASGKTGAAPDALILKSEVERVKKFPRRSSEVWVNKYEIDPVSALGATTPARDLGMLKLNRNGSFTYDRVLSGCLFECPVRLNREPADSTPPTNRESDMPDEKKTDAKPEEKRTDKPAADASQTGAAKGVEGKLDMLISMFQSFMEKQGAQAAPVPGQSATAADGAAPAAGGDEGGAISDEELEQMLASLGGDEGGEGAAEPEDKEDEDNADKSRKGEKPVQNSALADEVNVLRTKLARNEIKDRLRKAVERDNADIDAEDDKLITELVAMPEDMRESMIVRLSRNKSKASVQNRGHIAQAIQDGASGKKRVSSQDDVAKVMKLARQKEIKYEQAAEELGFTVG